MEIAINLSVVIWQNNPVENLTEVDAHFGAMEPDQALLFIEQSLKRRWGQGGGAGVWNQQLLITTGDSGTSAGSRWGYMRWLGITPHPAGLHSAQPPELG